MARLKTSGWESNSEGEFDGIQNTVSIVTSPVRNGTYAGRSQFGAVNSFEFQMVGSETSDVTFYTSVYLRIATAPDARTGVLFYGNNSGTQRCALAVETDRTLKLFDSTDQIGSASAVLATDTWYLIEMSYNNNTVSAKSELEGRLSGSSFASTTTSTNVGGVRYCRTGNQNGATTTGDFYFDDWAINSDASGSYGISWPSDDKTASQVMIF